MANGSTPSTDLEGTTEVEQQLTELVDAHEQIAWDRVPTVSVPEAAAWTQRLEQARQEAAQSQRLVADGGTSRRESLDELKALTDSQLEEEDHDIENVEEWGEFDSVYDVGSYSPHSVSFKADGEVSAFLFEDKFFDEREAEVFYDSSSVTISLQAKGEDPLSASAGAEFTPEEAKEIAVGIFQAAEEMSRWLEAEGGR